MAVALGFVVLCLAFDEVQSSVGQLEGEARTRLDSLMRLDEQVKRRESQWQLDKDRMAQQIARLEFQLQDAQRNFSKQLESKEHERRALADRLAVLQVQQGVNEQLQAQVAAASTQCTHEMQRTQQLQGDLMALQRRHQEALLEREQALSHCRMIETQYKTQSQQLIELQQACQSGDNQMVEQNLRAQVASLENELAALRAHTPEPVVRTQVVQVTTGLEEQRQQIHEMRKLLFDTEGKLWLSEQQCEQDRREPRPEELCLRRQFMDAVEEAAMWQQEAERCEALIHSLLVSHTPSG
jgi:chromosome segregation ATPase